MWVRQSPKGVTTETGDTLKKQVRVHELSGRFYEEQVSLEVRETKSVETGVEVARVRERKGVPSPGPQEGGEDSEPLVSQVFRGNRVNLRDQVQTRDVGWTYRSYRVLREEKEETGGHG